jgi:hypothetical protein
MIAYWDPVEEECIIYIYKPYKNIVNAIYFKYNYQFECVDDGAQTYTDLQFWATKGFVDKTSRN